MDVLQTILDTQTEKQKIQAGDCRLCPEGVLF